MCASMVQKAFSRCASDDFRRVLSRGLAVGGVAAKLVCGGGVGSGCSERVWRDAQACCCPAFQLVGRPPLPAAETLGLALGPGARVRPAVARPPAGSCEACDDQADLSCLVYRADTQTYQPYNKDWIKEKIYVLLRQQAQQARK
ncbi:hypothetical protein CB1_000898013 [Camelus ferus]|nr:hypothetical protein CB1_000898013 [Camelus ferus]